MESNINKLIILLILTELATFHGTIMTRSIVINPESPKPKSYTERAKEGWKAFTGFFSRSNPTPPSSQPMPARPSNQPMQIGQSSQPMQIGQSSQPMLARPSNQPMLTKPVNQPILARPSNQPMQIEQSIPIATTKPNQQAINNFRKKEILPRIERAIERAHGALKNVLASLPQTEGGIILLSAQQDLDQLKTPFNNEINRFFKEIQFKK